MHCWIALLLSVLLVGTARAEIEVRNGALWLHGVIDRETWNQFIGKSKPGMPVVLSSPGGDTGTAIAMADWVGRFNNPVVVKDRCYSACVLIFAMGKTRWMLPGSRIGIHGVGRPDPPVEPEREQKLRDYWTNRYIAQVTRGSPALAEAIRKRDMMGSFERMTYLTLADLDAIDRDLARQSPGNSVYAALDAARGMSVSAPGTDVPPTSTQPKIEQTKLDRLDPASYRGWEALGGGVTAAIVGPAMRYKGIKHDADVAKLVSCATVLHLCR